MLYWIILTSVSVTTNSSKTDQYGLKTKLVLNSEFVNLSLYDQLHQYLSVRPSINGSFFCHFNHEKVTRYQVTVILKSAPRFLGYNENDYNTHSFRIGAATHAAKMGKSDDEIMTMGRWKSDSYKRYIRIDTIIWFIWKGLVIHLLFQNYHCQDIYGFWVRPLFCMQKNIASPDLQNTTWDYKYWDIQFYGQVFLVCVGMS